MGLINWLKNKFKSKNEKKEQEQEQEEKNVEIQENVYNVENVEKTSENFNENATNEVENKDLEIKEEIVQQEEVIQEKPNVVEERLYESNKDNENNSEELKETNNENKVEDNESFNNKEEQVDNCFNQVQKDLPLDNNQEENNLSPSIENEDINVEEKQVELPKEENVEVLTNEIKEEQTIDNNEQNQINESFEDNNEEKVSDEDLEDIAIYNSGLEKSRNGFSGKLNKLAKKYKEANSDYFDELEECLIESDVGVSLAVEILRKTEDMAAQQHLNSPEDINNLMIDNMFMDYATKGKSFKTDIEFAINEPTVLMMVGVNGTGKTTTIAKLAQRYKEKGKKILLVAADTFRAGAVEQLKIWANRVGVDIFERGQGAEPASVCYDAIKKAIDEKYDLVIVDTAGRLHTKDYLMNELGKVQRVIGKILPSAPHEIWLALDANTGQNGIQQAKVFKDVCNLTGIVITKMDGTSKGGIILAIRDQLGIPVRFIGLGEHEHDLREFDLDKYLYGLLIGKSED